VATLRVRLCDADRQRFGGPEWVTYDEDYYMDLPASALMALEEEMGMSIGEAIRGAARQTAAGTKAALWLARRRAGLKEPFAEFDPRVWRVEAEVVHDDAPGGGDGDGPPVGSPAPGGQQEAPAIS
jgi:hypothetical protein